MDVGLIGLGKMGRNLAENLLEQGHNVVVFDQSTSLVVPLVQQGARGAQSLEEVVSFLVPPRILWLMVPAGEAVDQLVSDLADMLELGDMVIDGGNSLYLDTVRRARFLGERGIHLVDVGTSGGIYGARHGACLMVGGEAKIVSYMERIFLDISVENGYLYCGPSGSGHFVKMVHNGIEYGMMQAIGEGFELLAKSEYELDLDKIAKLYCHGSVIRGWLMELTHKALAENPELSDVKGIIHSSGEAQWTVEAALRLGVSTPIIAHSLFVRYSSVNEDSFGNRLVSSLRNQFGGHVVFKA